MSHLFQNDSKTSINNYNNIYIKLGIKKQDSSLIVNVHLLGIGKKGRNLIKRLRNKRKKVEIVNKRNRKTRQTVGSAQKTATETT